MKILIELIFKKTTPVFSCKFLSIKSYPELMGKNHSIQNEEWRVVFRIININIAVPGDYFCLSQHDSESAKLRTPQANSSGNDQQ